MKETYNLFEYKNLHGNRSKVVKCNMYCMCILGCVKKAIKECLIAVNFENLRCQKAEIVNIMPILHDSNAWHIRLSKLRSLKKQNCPFDTS